MNSVIRYNVTDFNNIMFGGFNYKLSDETMSAIQMIAEQVGAPEYVRTPQFPRREREHERNGGGVGMGGRRRGRGRAQEITDDDWQAIRDFQATEIIKKEGIGASIDLIRKHLNKITDKTYDVLSQEIVKEISSIVSEKDAESPDVLEDLNKVGDSIFNIASGNGFYSKMYATLYKDLMSQFSFMEKIFSTNFEQFRALFKTIEYCDPNKDYDKFCDNNKTNEKRRSVSLFYVNLMKAEIVGADSITDIITELQEYMMRLIVADDNQMVVEELSEVMFILITNSAELLGKRDEWEGIINIVTRISTMNNKSHPSISNKTIFKHMDMLDELN